MPARSIIRIGFDIGKVLDIDGMVDDYDYRFIEVPEYADATITFMVRYRKLNYEDLYLLNRVAEATFRITASADTLKSSETIWFKRTPDTFTNVKDQRSTPLNVGLHFTNLIGTSDPTARFDGFGSILFKNDHDLTYNLDVNNLFLNRNQGNMADFFNHSVRFTLG